MADTNYQQMLPIGTLLQNGKYRVVRYMASGGFGNTYEIEHVKLHKRLALKEFFMHGINQRKGLSVTVNQEENRPVFDQMREKFLHEAQRLAQLRHTHIVEVSDYFEENQTVYYVMTLIDGISLSAMMAKQKRTLTEEEVRHILPQVLSALKYVHAQGIYHLDLKPDNIMTDSEGNCWLIDFGASKQLSIQSHSLTTSTGLCYTSGFAPSEQINGNTKRIGPWTDFYSFGGTLYHLLTGQVPPSTDDIRDDGSAAFAFPATISPEMRQLIIHLMKQPPKERPQSVEEIEQRWLESVSRQNPRPASQPTQMLQTKPKRSSLWLWVTLGSIAVLMIAFVGSLMLLTCDDNYQDEADLQSEEAPLPAVIQNLVDNMVYVEGGSFLMGRESEGDFSCEYPAHYITLSPFYIGRYEVTQEEWEAVMADNPSYFQGERRPVENVSWDECQEFIETLNVMTGMAFRLPTEAEWEYAARGGQLSHGYLYSGSDIIDSVAVYDNHAYRPDSVGHRQPNELGLYDMSGNVEEWCQDYYDEEYYKKSPSVDPCNENENFYSLRIVRGGCWNYSNYFSKVTYRSGRAQATQDSNLGLRLVR